MKKDGCLGRKKATIPASHFTNHRWIISHSSPLPYCALSPPLRPAEAGRPTSSGKSRPGKSDIPKFGMSDFPELPRLEYDVLKSFTARSDVHIKEFFCFSFECISFPYNIGK